MDDTEFQHEHEQLLRDFRIGTPMPPVEGAPGGSVRPKVRLAWTEGDYLEIGGTIGGTLDVAERDGKLPEGTAKRFERQAMPPPIGDAPMVEYRDMLRHLLETAAKYIEIEDAYPEDATDCVDDDVESEPQPTPSAIRGSADDMDQFLARPQVTDEIKVALDRLPIERAAPLRAVLSRAGDANRVRWDEVPDLASELAGALEAVAFDTADLAVASFRLNAATMIRVRGGGVARAGSPFDWEWRGTLWQAGGPTGTSWVVHPYVDGWGVVIAMWERPDWWCASEDDARALAEEIDARPKFPTRLHVVEPLSID
jgi:hypothetical protein